MPITLELELDEPFHDIIRAHHSGPGGVIRGKVVLAQDKPLTLVSDPGPLPAPAGPASGYDQIDIDRIADHLQAKRRAWHLAVLRDFARRGHHRISRERVLSMPEAEGTGSLKGFQSVLALSVIKRVTGKQLPRLLTTVTETKGGLATAFEVPADVVPLLAHRLL